MSTLLFKYPTIVGNDINVTNKTNTKEAVIFIIAKLYFKLINA
jgi:hypothetical protein